MEQTWRAGVLCIRVTKRSDERGLTLTFQVNSDRQCVVHWGLRSHREKRWQRPPQAVWPPQSAPFDQQALHSSLSSDPAGGATLTIRFGGPLVWVSLPFVLYFPEERRWVKNGKQDFCVALPAAPETPNPVEALSARTADADWDRQGFALGDGETLAAAVLESEQRLQILFATDVESPLWLHWGFAAHPPDRWQVPPKASWPPGTWEVPGQALQTPFQDQDGLRWLEMVFDKALLADGARGINMVLYAPTQDRWIKAGGRDMHVPLSFSIATSGIVPSRSVQQLTEAIVNAETVRKSWTLMHRSNLCYDLLDGVQGDEEALALLYAWLRYSAIRQLDWQRRYNTKPRELSAAQERLTERLARIFAAHPTSRFWVRLMLTTMGPGGEGQRVRDEILNIMHRHHIKEAHGTFLEEWHQKLHNNTTPDDIAICQAYLAFLRSDGQLERFYDTLARGGVSRERLQSFERPIKTDPQFYAAKKAGLLHDFENFLRILRSVHSGMDMESAVAAARSVVDAAFARQLDQLQGEVKGLEAVVERVQALTTMRERLAALDEPLRDPRASRHLLYLDLALEQALRVVIEQQTLRHIDMKLLTSLVWAMLRNLALSLRDEEFAAAGRQLAGLLAARKLDVAWALQVKSVTDRAARAIGDWSHALYGLLQPKAELLGKVLGVASWTIPLFSEEVIRGNLPFVLSLLLQRLDPMLRACAHMGGWQIISPACAAGRVHRAESLAAVQGNRYPDPAVLIVDRVSGDEEIPEGVTAVITSDTPDLLSHVAVRARNAPVLFASCFDGSIYGRLKAFANQLLRFEVSATGEVIFQEAGDSVLSEAIPRHKAAVAVRPRRFSTWAVTAAEFSEKLVGGKSNNLTALRGRLPEWIHFPASIAVPFGVFEETLRCAENRVLADRYQGLLAKLEHDPQSHLPQLRDAVLALQAPVPLKQALDRVWRQQGLPLIEWPAIWQAMRRVWASKWNDRAYFSRTAHHIVHDDLMLAVLIQQVVEADYAFVIHTTNPLTQRDDELFAEVVVGMGETLVGNYPGRALGFIGHKQDLTLTFVSYPSKSAALYGRGVIFRSDSNGEDLEGFAGAGLYDSLLAEPPSKRLVDYSDEPLVWDQRFCQDLLKQITRIGIEVEAAVGAPQDIEGAVQKGQFYVVQTRSQVGL